MMPQDDQPAKKNKTHMIGFRVDEDVFNEIDTRAILAGKSSNDWCRDELLVRLSDDTTLTANEELIHADVVRFGNVLATFLHLLANNKLTPESSQKLLDALNIDGKTLAKMYYSRLARNAREEMTNNPP
jgi:hypothetical protein